MIVTCEACRTKFNLSDEFIKPSGSKVRCSKCHQVFRVYPTITEEPTPALPAEASDINLDLSSIPAVFESSQISEKENRKMPIPDHSLEPPAFTKESLNLTEYDFSEIDKLFQLDKPDQSFENQLEDMNPALETKTGTSESVPPDVSLDKPDVSLDEFEKSLEMSFDDFSLISPADEETLHDSALEIVETEITKDQKTKDDLFSEDEFGGFKDIEDLDLSDIEALLDKQDADIFTTSLSDDPENIKLSDSAVVSASSAAETDETLNMEDQYLTFDELQLDRDKSESAAPLKVKESISPDIEIPGPAPGPSLQKEPEIQKTEAGEKEKPLPTDTDVDEESEETQSAPQKGISSKMIFALILVVIAGLVYGGYILLNSVGIPIPFISEPVSSKVQDPGNYKIKPFDISGRFIDNTKIGKLFIIMGKVKNEYPTDRGSIQVIGKLYTHDKAMAKAETVFCGNMLSDIDLANADPATIYERLQNRSGDNGANLKVAPGDAISFMVVFSNLPDNLEEFTLEVSASAAI
jgi:predicted Zn finger-like uncharacterized protein